MKVIGSYFVSNYCRDYFVLWSRVILVVGPRFFPLCHNSNIYVHTHSEKGKKHN